MLKKKVQQHIGRCRAPVTCIDCSVTFPGQAYKEHNECISEDQKYQGKLYRPKQKGPGPKQPAPAPAPKEAKIDAKEDVKEGAKENGKEKKSVDKKTKVNKKKEKKSKPVPIRIEKKTSLKSLLKQVKKENKLSTKEALQSLVLTGDGQLLLNKLN